MESDNSYTYIYIDIKAEEEKSRGSVAKTGGVHKVLIPDYA